MIKLFKNITLTALVAFFSVFLSIQAEEGQLRGGVEVGFSPVDLEAEETAQQLANLSGSTVTVEYDTGAFVGRLFGNYGITSNMDVEVGYFQTSDIDATYKIGSDSATESYSANGIDFSLIAKGDTGFYGKAGVHSSTIDAFGSIKIGSTTYSVTEQYDGSSWLAGAGFEQDNVRYSFTHYNNIGGDGGADFNMFSVAYLF